MKEKIELIGDFVLDFGENFILIFCMLCFLCFCILSVIVIGFRIYIFIDDIINLLKKK